MGPGRRGQVAIGILIALLLMGSTTSELVAQVQADSLRQAIEPDSVLVLPGIAITSGRSGVGYVEASSEVGLGFPAELRRVPQSVHVLSNRMLREQLPVTLSDIVRNTGGVSAARSSVETFRSFKLRGFDIGETIVDGMRSTGSLNIQAEGLANVERVEILRGPGGAVFGMGSPGGVVNVVTKRPERIPTREFSLRIGNYSHVEGLVDLTGPLGASERLRYRLVGSYGERDSHIDFVSPTRWQVAPSIEIDLGAELSLRYQLDARSNQVLRYISHPFAGTVNEEGPLRHPRSLFTGEPGQGLTKGTGQQHSLTLERSRGPVEAGIDRLYLRWNVSDYDQPSVAPVAVQEDGRTLNRRFNRFIEAESEMLLGATTHRRMEFAGHAHTLSAGFDLARWTYDSEFLRGSITPLDLGNPLYGAEPSGIFQLAHSRDRFVQVGAFLQNAVALHPDMVFLVGARIDRLTQQTGDLPPEADPRRTSVTEISPRVGISWEVAQGIIPFASFSRNFQAGPSFGFVRSRDEAPFPPQGGEQWEAGIRFTIPGELLLTLAAFQLERTNVPTPDPDDPFFRILTGLQRSRGLEVLGSYEPSAVLSLFGSYAYTDARVVEDTNISPGTRLDNVPYHSGRAWSRIALLRRPDGNAGINVGASYSSSVRAALNGPEVVPGFTVLDAGGFVSWGDWSAQISVSNLTDRYYFLRGAFGGSGVIPGDGRRLIGALTWTR